MLTGAELDKVRTACRAWMTADRPGPKSSGDLADIIELMLATGARLGEVLALRWSDIDLDARSIDINATIKTETGKGTYRKALDTTRSANLPECAMTMLRRRYDAYIPAGTKRPSRPGTGPGNVERLWRQVRRETGLEWVTPHTFRMTAIDR